MNTDLNKYIGKQFGFLKVVKFIDKEPKKRRLVECICKCGSNRIVYWDNLKSGKSTSCGCKRKDTLAITKKKHGDCSNPGKTRLYRIWTGIKTRCYNSNRDQYDYYGGRGIVMCDEWRECFELFKLWATKNGYSDNLTIERIDVNGNYTPDNCTWIPMSKQARNTRNTVLWNIDGTEKTIPQIAEEHGINKGLIWGRISKGLSIENSIEPPAMNGKPVMCITDGRIFNSMSEARREYGGTNIPACCRGERKHSGRHPVTGEKCRWKFVN